MPGTQDGEPVLLPVDAKFPREAWERLEDVQSRGDQAVMKEAGNKLEAVIRVSAKTIKEKYILPPTTTSFAVMFLPTEGLFAEVVRRPGLVDDIQTNYHVCLAGPICCIANEPADGLPYFGHTEEGQRGLEAARCHQG